METEGVLLLGGPMNNQLRYIRKGENRIAIFKAVDLYRSQDPNEVVPTVKGFYERFNPLLPMFEWTGWNE